MILHSIIIVVVIGWHGWHTIHLSIDSLCDKPGLSDSQAYRQHGEQADQFPIINSY